ncbi:MAG TPA: hypothetical protein VK973_05840 [Arenicellales bacterium]|nr:hypothetical protein [Arenicellales bacterium]
MISTGYLATAYDLTPEQIRDLLDSRFGRHLADDLSFIDGGPTEPDVIQTHIMQRLAKGGWRRWFNEAVRYVRQG